MDALESAPEKTSWLRKISKSLLHPFAKTTLPMAQAFPQTAETGTKPSKPEDGFPIEPPKPTTGISGKAQRAARKAEYKRQKAIREELDGLHSDSKQRVEDDIASTSLTVQAYPQGKPDSLPSGFKEVKHSDTFLHVKRNDMPWLKEDENIPLAKITLSGTDEKTFFYGSCIRERLVDATNMLDEHQSRIANNLLYSHIPPFIQTGSHPYIKRVDDEITEKPIYCVYNKGGNRVYFMRFDDINKRPVIIRIAVCDKSGEGQRIVLGALTNTAQGVIKRAGKL